MSPQDLGRLFSERDGYMKLLDIELADISAGYARVHMRIGKEHLNLNGTCHGGVIFSLADCAFGISSNSHGVVAAGIDAHITYHAAACEGNILSATSREISRSRKLATYRIEVTGGDEKLIAAFTGTVYIIGKPHTPDMKQRSSL